MRNQSGNALVYILIAVGLMAALTYAISRDNRGQQVDRLSGSEINLVTSDIIDYAVSAKQTVFQMTQWGADYDDLRFDLPGSADYNTDTGNQVYHPAGGGLSPMEQTEKFSDSTWLASGANWDRWHFNKSANVEWSPTSANDLVLSIGGLKRSVCEEINKRLTGSTTIPDLAPFEWIDHFQQGGADPFLEAECSECVGRESLCVGEVGETPPFYLFYNIVGAR